MIIIDIVFINFEFKHSYLSAAILKYDSQSVGSFIHIY